MNHTASKPAPDEKQQVNRRAFVRVMVAGAGVLGGISASPSGASAAPAPGSTGIAGHVVTVSRGSLEVLTRKGPVRVTAAADARMYSGIKGLVDSLDEFVVGDRVVAEGRLDGDTLVAVSVGSVLEPLSIRVDSVAADGSAALSSAGTIRLNTGRLPDGDGLVGRPVRGGDRLDGVSWRDPATGETYLLLPASAKQ